MASIVQCVFSNGASASITATAGNVLVVCTNVITSGGSWTMPSDGHNTYSSRLQQGSASFVMATWDAPVVTGGALTVTNGRQAGIVSAYEMYVFEVQPSGVLAYDTGNSAQNTTGVPTTASFTPAGAGELILAFCAAQTASSGSMTAGTGFTLQRTDGWGLGGTTDSAGCEYILSGASGAQTATMNPSQSVQWNIIALAYTDTVTPGSVPPQLMRRGLS